MRIRRNQAPARRGIARLVTLGVIGGLLPVPAVVTSGQAAEVTFTVDSLLDVADSSPDGACSAPVGDGSVCTLRAAIQESNDGENDHDSIAFSVAGTIVVADPLPELVEPVTINGGATPPLVEIRPGEADAAADPGLVTQSSGIKIFGLAISGFTEGIRLSSDNNVIDGNFLGPRLDGNQVALGGNGVGLRIAGASSNIVTGNLISGNNLLAHPNGAGIWIATTESFPADFNVIWGNRVGVNGAGTGALPNTGPGIAVDGALNPIGGTGAGEGNIISGNTGPGVLMTDPGFAFSATNPILSNSISGNGELGIDIVDDVGLSAGVSPNGTFQPNFPVITSIGPGTVSGTLAGTTGETYRVEVFANDACDASGHGEGQTFLGGTALVLPAGGAWTVSGLSGTPGPVVTATATLFEVAESTFPLSTSEFSQCATPPPAPPSEPPSEEDPEEESNNNNNGGGGSSTPSRRGSDSSSCSSGDACTVRVVTSDEVFDITAEKGRSAKLKAKLDGGDGPKCQGSKSASRHWAQFWFAKGGSDRAKTIEIYVTDLDDNQKYNWFVNRQNVCYGAPYEFEAKDGYSLTRDRKGEFIGMLPDCRQLHPGFDNNSWWAKRVDSPCIAERKLTRKWDERVVRITVVIPANELDPRVRRDV